MQLYANISRIGSKFLALRTLAFIVLFVSAMLMQSSIAATIRVPADQTTIQDAIDAAVASDEIIVSPGTYYENIDFGGKNIILRSTYPTTATTIAETVIDGTQSGPVVSFSGSESPSCVLSGFSIINGYAPWGGGIYGESTEATIQNNHITSNTAYASPPGGRAGAIYKCDGIIENNVIYENTAKWGCAFYGCDGIIESNIIYGNNAEVYGGAFAHCDALIENNIIYGNSAATGGAFYQCKNTIQNNTIYGNSASVEGGGLAHCNDIIRNNIIWANTAPSNAQLANSATPSYCCIQDWTGGGIGNITDNPELADPASGDFHLLLSSLCIDAGGNVTLAEDFEDDPRPFNAVTWEVRGDGSDFDIGADEYIPVQSLAVFSEHDSPVPPVGVNYFTDGALINAYMTDPMVTESGAQYACTGWIGEGSVPTSGTTTLTTFHLDESSTITWLWQAEAYYLDATANPPEGGSVTLSDGITSATGWYSVDEDVEVLAVPSVDYYFIDWSGDLSGSANPNIIKMDSPKSIIANFSRTPPATPTPTPSPTPSPTPVETPTPIETPTPSPTPWQIVFDFVENCSDWTSATVPVVFDEPDFLCEVGHLSIFPKDNLNTFGYWKSPDDAIPIEDEYLYRTRFNVSTDLTDQSIVPQFRLRANSANFQQADYITIESTGDGGASPVPSGTDYDLYFVPPTNDNYMVLAFDLLNFNPLDSASGELRLNNVQIVRFPLDELSTSTVVQSYSFETGTESWTTEGAPIVYTLPIFTHADEALNLEATNNTDTFGYWQSDATDIMIEEEVLYRGLFEVRTNVTDQSRVPQMRLRFNTENLQASCVLSIESIGDGGNSPETVNTLYDRLCFVPPANCVGQGLIISFDMLNFSPEDNAVGGQLILDEATIQALSVPAWP